MIKWRYSQNFSEQYIFILVLDPQNYIRLIGNFYSNQPREHDSDVNKLPPKIGILLLAFLEVKLSYSIHTKGKDNCISRIAISL